MAVETLVVPVSMGGGLDNKTDPKQVIPGKLVRLRNAIFQTQKKIRKRDGNEDYPVDVLGGSDITAGVMTASYKDELIELDGKKLYSYSDSTLNWINKGGLTTSELSVNSVVRTGNNQEAPDSAINGNLRAYAWTDTSQGGIRYSIIDTDTGQNIVNNQVLIAVSISGPSVVSVGNYFVIFYTGPIDDNNIYYKFIDVATPTTLSVQTSLATDSESDYKFDAQTINNTVYIAYGNTSASVSMYSLSSTLVKSSQFSPTTNSAIEAINVYSDSSNNIWVSYANTTHVIYTYVANPALSALILANTSTTTSPSVVRNLTGVVSGTTSTIYYETGDTVAGYTTLFNNIIRSTTITALGVTTASVIFNRGLGLASRAFLYNGVKYFLTVFPTPLQSTYFLLNDLAEVVVKISQSNGGPASGHTLGDPKTQLAHVNTVSTGVFEVVTIIKDEIVAFSTITETRSGTNVAGIFTQTGIQSNTITLEAVATAKLVAGDNLLIGGGAVHVYDGGTVSEFSYNYYPEGVDSGLTTSGGGIGIGATTSLTNQFQHVAIYEWMDNQGQLHRSAPSVPIPCQVSSASVLTFSGTTTIHSPIINSVSSLTGLRIGQVIISADLQAGTIITGIFAPDTIEIYPNATGSTVATVITTYDINTINVVVPTLRLTKKERVQIVIYRTELNGTVFYRVTDPNDPLFNDTTVDTVTFNDRKPDSQIIGNEQLYTTGGELENIAPPALSDLTGYKNRVLGIPSENKTSLWYSKQIIPGVPAEFSDSFIMNVDPLGGELTLVRQMDDKMILFKENSIFYTAGEGPTPAGTQNDFAEPQVISSDTGCSVRKSAVLMPLGLMYRSPKGIYLMSRSLENLYIGKDVQDLKDEVITSAQMLADQNLVVFTTVSGTGIVYDYIENQWGTFTNFAAVDSTMFNNKMALLRSSGVIALQTPGQYLDGISPYFLGLTFGWMNFAGIQGYQRVRRLLLVGDYKSPHTLTATINYDFSDTYPPEQVVPIPVTGDPGVYQYRIHLETQKAESIQIALDETQPASGGTYEGFSLSAISFEAGVKKGLNKLPAAKSYG